MEGKRKVKESYGGEEESKGVIWRGRGRGKGTGKETEEGKRKQKRKESDWKMLYFEITVHSPVSGSSGGVRG